jgi:hypothetical protein
MAYSGEGERSAQRRARTRQPGKPEIDRKPLTGMRSPSAGALHAGLGGEG